jgi:hypothetical protein
VFEERRIYSKEESNRHFAVWRSFYHKDTTNASKSTKKRDAPFLLMTEGLAVRLYGHF